MYFQLLDDTAWAEALQYNTDVDGADVPDGFVLDPGHDKLPAGYTAWPVRVYSGDYTGSHFLPVRLSTVPYYSVMWDFLVTLPVVDAPPSSTWPPEDDG